MARSLKKGPFVHYSLDKKFNRMLKQVKKQLLKHGLEHL